MSLGFANDDGAPTMGGGWLAEIRPRFSRYTLLVSMMSPPVATASSSKFNARLFQTFKQFKSFQ